ncbi:MAG: TRAP transporter small permease [Bosea sp. (in: a-proteobacteria)]|nr:TRAP transporter small permease [Bosea sp. (in: a-proteobacteria)]
MLVLPVRILETLVKILVVLALVVVLTFTVGQVADRYVLKTQFDAHDQIARIGMVWMAFLGFALGVRDRINIRIEVIQHFLPDRVRRFAGVFLDVVMLAIACILLWNGWQLLEVGSFQSIMGTPLYYDVMYGALLAGLVLLVIFLLLRIADTLSGGRLGVDTVNDHADHH